ncbi:hypothetical protein LCGC14_2572610 [marine sediment metagenome]|uniref:Uncharacterized protein n=1 Tax=marine sediment metagenome TaxID=412755 RepID=A0A0F9AGU5_9ZZZZ
MPVAAPLNQTVSQPSILVKRATQGINQLPKDLEKVVGKTYLIAIDIISKIKAFFSAIFYGKLNNWKGFRENIDRRFDEISTDKKNKLYDQYRKPSLNPNYTLKVGYKTESEEEANSLKESNNNLRKYKEFKIEFTKEEFEKIKAFLEKISSKETQNASNILIDLNTFLSSADISKEVKDLIDRKLNQLPEYKTLKKNLEEKKHRLHRYNNIKKAAIITAAFIATLGVVALYQYLRVPMSIPEIPVQNSTISLDYKSWFNIKILGRTSNEDVRNVFWKVGEFFLKRPYEITKNSKFLMQG